MLIDNEYNGKEMEPGHYIMTMLCECFLTGEMKTKIMWIDKHWDNDDEGDKHCRCDNDDEDHVEEEIYWDQDDEDDDDNHGDRS